MIYGAFRLKFPAGRQAPFRSLPSYAAAISFWLKKPTGKKNLFSPFFAGEFSALQYYSFAQCEGIQTGFLYMQTGRLFQSGAVKPQLYGVAFL